jgi:hypothetical protein
LYCNCCLFEFGSEFEIWYMNTNEICLFESEFEIWYIMNTNEICFF